MDTKRRLIAKSELKAQSASESTVEKSTLNPFARHSILSLQTSKLLMTTELYFVTTVTTSWSQTSCIMNASSSDCRLLTDLIQSRGFILINRFPSKTFTNDLDDEIHLSAMHQIHISSSASPNFDCGMHHSEECKFNACRQLSA